MQLTRREGIASALALAATACAPAGLASAGAEPAGASSLKALAARSGRRFGSALAWGNPGEDRGSFANPAYAALLERECAVLVPENELKWAWTRPSAREYDFRQFDAIVDYATSKGFALRGHTLFWAPEKWFPKWLVGHDFGARPAMTAEAMLVEHVRTVCRRYGTKIGSYDVVNEAVEPETGAIRDTVMTRAMGGEAMLDVMFRTARAEAPHAQLIYNDYMSWERGTEDETHITGVLKLLEGFRKRGTPVDALGIQSHIRLLKKAPVAEIVRESEGPWRRFLDAVVGMGFDLVITELDVNDQQAPDDIAVRDRMVADYARAYLDVMLSYRQMGDVLAWGMVDKYNWLTGFDPRADKSIKRGTPYDSAFRAKPLREAIAAAFENASSRHG
ncbi:endo-1,4-beta-xylanase [Allosphingosinicella deserti]|uniref:Beta-xylanase n=1 Tax=Allosphingosinicella deserti TaxID=2116704 RepID=A0A2P7QKG5_9SPHN|nr:endo-1,4-beta-xylanase [Sphingomonas deserti]PSJ38479.1 glycosyl hydrolase [Sphingomonas deserti]